MKQGSFKAICLVSLAFMAVVTVFGDENTVDSTSVIIESFDGDSDYVWKLDGSKFATKTDDDSFPKVSYVSAWPQALFGLNREEKELKSLGIWGRFDRRGYNWIDVYPTKSGEEGDEAEAVEIPLPGRVQSLDMWVWGSNLNYRIEAYVRDYRGVIHVLDLGNIKYQGWKDLRVQVPARIPQSKLVLPRLAALNFVKFRIWTQPSEPVNNFYVYFDHFKVLTDTFETLFDGNDLALPERVQELWDTNN
jgi:hypothetical protein